MKRWKCSVCGYEHEGANPPEKCPLCGAPAEKFIELDDKVTEEAADTKNKELDLWNCSACGYKHEGEGLPENCPLCGVPAEKFIKVKASELEQEIKKEPASTEDGKDAVKTKEKSTSEKKTFLDFLRQRILHHHLHPISVHFPNGILPAAFVFLVLASWLGVQELELAAFFNLIFVLINMPLVMLSGYLEWQGRYRGATTLLFKAKIGCSLIVLVCLTWLVGWRLINPEIIVQEGSGRWIYLSVAAFMVAAAGVTGHLGGKLVFSSRS